MKKGMFLCLAMLGWLQGAAQTGFHIGVLGGPQNTWILNRDDKDAGADEFKYKMTWGYSGMFKLGYNLGPPFGIHSGVIYSSQGQGSVATDSLSGTESTFRRSLTYVKIPLLIHMSSDPDAPAMFVLEIGPQFGLLLKGQHYLNGDLVDVGYDFKQVYMPNEIEVAWAIGADIRLNDYVVLNLHHRGDYGIADVENKDATIFGLPYYPADRLKANNLNLGFNVGLTAAFEVRGGSTRKQLFWR